MLRQFRVSYPPARILLATCVFLCTSGAALADAAIERFVGSFTGSAGIVRSEGMSTKRDMSVRISETKRGFNVTWTSTSYRSDGRAKDKTYSIDFAESERDGVYAAAMQRNVFGHDGQLDPMKGEPYVWARIKNDTLTVFSMFVTDDGGYEMQQYNRTLAEGGLMLEFHNLLNGEPQRSVKTFLERE